MFWFGQYTDYRVCDGHFAVFLPAVLSIWSDEGEKMRSEFVVLMAIRGTCCLAPFTAVDGMIVENNELFANQ